MAGGASQRHKLAIRGVDAAGNRQGILRCPDNWGTDTDTAKIIVEGMWDATETANVTTDIGGGNVASAYTPSGAESINAAATGLAAVINGKADHTATATENVVYITKSTAGTVEVVSSSVTST